MLPYAKRKSVYRNWALLAGAATIFFPLSLHHVDFRSTFSLGVSISAHKASPAYAAFEDLREDYADSFPQLPEKMQTLAAGTPFDMKVARQSVAMRQVTLTGMTVRAPAQEPLPLKQTVYVASTSLRRQPANLQDSMGDLLPLPERKRRLLEELKQEDWSTPSPTRLAQQLVEREVHYPSEQILRSTNGDPILVRRPEDEAALATNDLLNGAAYSSTLMTHNPDPDNMRPLWLTGQVEMTGGLAFIGPDTQIVIKRVFNGRNFEQGRIWVTEGRFEIHVNQPSGFLVAELQTRDHRVLGRGEMNLLDITGLPKDDKVGNLRIALRPTAEGVTITALSGYSHDGQRIAVVDARVEIQAYSEPQKTNSEGVVSEPTLSRDSSFVARGLARDHWSSLVVGQARDPQDIRLFKNSLVDALISLSANASDKKEAFKQSVIWGRLTQKGKPLADAHVEMAGDYQPIYFNEMYLPDPHLTGTSKNGLFAFIRVRAGVQALRIKVAGKLYPAQVFPTEEKHVSYLELDVRDKAISQFKVFDGLNMRKPVSARIRLVGTDESLPVQREDFVEYSVAANPFMVEADAGAEYEVSRVTVTGSPHVVHIPLVSREWLSSLAQQRSIGLMPARGTVVGFMDEQDFETELTGYTPGETMQIVYFDAEGHALDSKTGVAGGGFVVFNAPSGMQTLYVHPVQSRETFSQIVVAEPEFVQVVTH